MLRLIARFAIVGFVGLLASNGKAAPPTGWDSTILPRGEYRQTIQATPIEQRPGRPLHVYGNTIRYQVYYAGRPGWHRPVQQVILGTDRLRDMRD